jgi:hypothetical protein
VQARVQAECAAEKARIAALAAAHAEELSATHAAAKRAVRARPDPTRPDPASASRRIALLAATGTDDRGRGRDRERAVREKRA